MRRSFMPAGRRNPLNSALTLRRTAAALALLAAGACASIQSDNASRDSILARSHKVVLVEMPMREDEALLRSQFAKDAAAKAQAVALADMRNALARRPGLTVDDSVATAQAVTSLHLDNPDVAITKDLAPRLHAISGADELVRFRITDYGVTPKAWRNGYIVFEVTSTLAIAAIAYAYPATRALAGVYLVEEAVEETVEGYAGFWALDQVGRPVRIEAQLISLGTGTEEWKGAATGFSDIRAARLLRKVGSAEQDAQRARATDKAVRKLAAKIPTGY